MERQCFSDPLDLITANRLDIAFRLAYLKYRELNLSLAESYYYEVIKIQSFNKFTDPDNENRSNFLEYLNDFEKLIESINKKGFNSSISTIPLADDGSILNGAHRVAIALFLDKKVFVTKKTTPRADCSVKYLTRYGMPNFLMESAVVDLLSCSDKFRVVVLWPSSGALSKSASKIFKNIFYTKEIEFSELGKLNFLFEAYNHMDWIGTTSNNFRGIRQKIGECFPLNKNNKIILHLIKEGEVGDVHIQKSEFRKQAGLGYSSVHTTDNTQESNALARIVLSKPGLHYINFANYSRFNFRQKAQSIRDSLVYYDINSEHVLFTGSIILEAYGLRQSNDLDYFSLNNLPRYFGPSHDSQLKFYPSSKLDLIYSPDNYFWFEGIKIISLSVLKKMKENRGENKDIHDLYLIEQVMERQSKRDYLTGFKTKYYFLKVRIENNIYTFIVRILNILGIKKIAKKVFIFLRK
jgi:hypothetical protein